MSDKKFFDEDSEVAAKAQQGDMRAFEVLVKKYQGNIYNFALHFFRSSEMTEDITQEVFLRAFRFLHTYDPSRRFLTWLYSIARNLCIDKHREKAKTDRVSIDDVPPGLLISEHNRFDPLNSLERKEVRRVLDEAITRLPEKYRTPIVLCYLEEMPYQEISDVLNISLNNTKIRIFRAKKMLLEILGISEDT